MESSLEEVFNAFMGGYWGPSYYFYINKVKDGYQFRYGYDKDGRIINNTIIGINLYKSFHDEEYYDSFISKLLELTHEWKEEYYDSDIMDGMQWDIHFWQLNKTYAGSNNFPQNYKEVMDYVKESFNVRPDVNASALAEKEEVEMAEIRNKTVKEAREILKELGLELEINNLTEEINENETYVKEQIPKPGIKITKETKVYIDI